MAIYKYSALELKKAFLSGEISAVEITTYFLHRIEKSQEKLGTFLEVCREYALEKAHRLDIKKKQKQPLGKMAAIPIAIKDNTHIKNVRTTCGSKFLENYIAPFSATVVDLLEEEDAILLGKTNLDEFAMGSSNENSAYFSCQNPWNLSYSPGGSSGGSAAAVAARLVPLATGSDTGGSIRQPAAFCGIVGFKPTYGRVSRYGLVAFGSSLDQIGPMSSSVSDAALMMETIGKYCKNDATSLRLPPESYLENLPKSLKGIKIGVPWHFLEQLQPSAHGNFSKSIEKIQELGGEIIDINLDILSNSIACYYILSTAEASTNLARFDGIRYGKRAKADTLDAIYDLSRDQGFGLEVKNRILLGTFVLSAGYQDAFYKKAQKVRTLIIRAFEQAFEACDCICMPTSPDAAFALNSLQDPIQMYLQDIFTIAANLAGLPAISIPSGFSSDQRPYGLQILGPQLHDVSVIRYAYAIEQSTAFARKIPPAFDKELS